MANFHSNCMVLVDLNENLNKIRFIHILYSLNNISSDGHFPLFLKDQAWICSDTGSSILHCEERPVMILLHVEIV